MKNVLQSSVQIHTKNNVQSLTHKSTMSFSFNETYRCSAALLEQAANESAAVGLGLETGEIH